jgi:hypothetical protein
MPINPATIIAGIKTVGELAKAIGAMSTALPKPPSDLTGKARWVTVTVFNQTQYDLVYQDSYFDSGRFWTAPTNVPPFKQMTFSACDKDNSLMTGVSGGVQFSIAIPGNPQQFAAGFSNPYAGANKASVLAGASATPQAAYDAITDVTARASIPALAGKDINGKDVTLSFSLASAPGAEASVTVTQQVSGA